MRIVTWNCNASARITSPHTASAVFAQKVDNLKELAPEVAVLQEVPQPENLSTTTTQWYGSMLGRGIAVVTANDFTIEPASVIGTSYSALPLRVNGSVNFNLLAMWSRPKHSSLKHYVVEMFEVIETYRAFLMAGPCVVVGDFNSNACWDEDVGEQNHSALVRLLANDFGLVSSYHTKYRSAQGREQHPTFYKYRHSDKPFHIDYCFVPKNWGVESVSIGAFTEWSTRSDHCPLIVDIAV